MIKEFEKGNTIYFECSYRDFDGALVDPKEGTASYKILDSKGNEEEKETPTRKSKGVYYFYWTSSEVDTYLVEFSGTIGDEEQPGLAREKFKVTQTTI